MNEEKLLLTGCGILKKEVHFLIKKNNWPVETLLLNSALHCDLKKLKQALTGVLKKQQAHPLIVFYGTCHPQMDQILTEGHTFRTQGQNCVEILLGPEQFQSELAKGAFFLLEDWAQRWQEISAKALGTTKPEIIREIYHESGIKYLLAIKTPCSGDFSHEAQKIAELLKIPARWMNVDLKHLEQILQNVVEQKLRELHTPHEK
ncbi:hypothetical protein COW36_03200 [bacterium (Candidatus Blackallbacteria) CG17_big_fil_post_rev_8_21_14_2_50_48_46]|uniref:DUF1638 domain-containing protein n=1 Tax=bacterium (Candidatus Blackallbacteria) CG17_big_fil_post_rev_8_21_14_2_50_48_46 TaxID=2014261 RepID=A0A2M7G9Q8_9BACT|nr:MAG: hypothetical protein COW64_08705 [bacterium (Candidatus Blackallbacteria) CG18_big_fil_WC_8_21_14_2_50_49_26]PIW18863.1 MAG: hypothetical protein COW36_03200 [bacterium (Candidatus Blackallbacteria) CG17_big_fil_post_rev_8_21_14_2_50_48_46]PIW44854.1 MAG: hypothetical protein COW20_22595 [bacterium (Candidatus Blackallbacteria) CG13_big_fil_rev_8_21_14_2_50_49_14]